MKQEKIHDLTEAAVAIYDRYRALGYDHDMALDAASELVEEEVENEIDRARVLHNVANVLGQE